MWFGDQPPPVAPTYPTPSVAAPAPAPAATPAPVGVIPPGVTGGFTAPTYAQPTPQQNAYPNPQSAQTTPQPGSGYQQPTTTNAPAPVAYNQANSAPMGGGMAATGTPPVAATPQVNELGMAWIANEGKWYHVSSGQYFDSNTNQWSPAPVPPPGFGLAAAPVSAAVPATSYGGTSADWQAQQAGGAPPATAYNPQPTATGAPVDYNAGAVSGYPQGYNQPNQPGYGQAPYGYNPSYPQTTATTGPPVGYDQSNQGYAGYTGAAPATYTPQIPPQTNYHTGGAPAYGQSPYDPATAQYGQPGAGGGYLQSGQPTYDPAAGQYGQPGATNPNAGAVTNNAWANAQPPQSTPQQIAPPVQPVQSVQPMTGGTNNYGGGAPQMGGSTGGAHMGGGAPASSGPAAPGMCKACKVKAVWKESNGRAHDYCGKTCARNDGQKV